MPLRALLLASSAALAPLPAAAGWEIDPAHTQVMFTVSHFGFVDITGTFRDLAGEVAFDADDIEATEVSFTIQAASVDTQWEARDEHIRTDDFLDVANHPEITFVATEVTSTGEDTASITGDLTIRGATRPLTLDATLNQIGPHPFNPAQEIAGFTLTGEIDRTDFGVDFGAPVLGVVLPLTVNVELTREAM